MRQEAQMRKCYYLLTALLVSCSLTIPAFAALTGDLQGTVVDPSGAVVVGAKVTIKNKSTGATKLVMTDQSGEFAALQLDLGEYSVSIEKSGMKTVEQTALIRSAEKTRLDIKLELGNATDVVTVEAATPTLDV